MIDSPALGEGFYVPMKAVVHEGGKHHVYVVADGPGGGKVAKRASVTLGGTIGQMQRIEGDDITEGARIVLHGVAYLTPDEPVNVIEVRKVQP